MPLGDLLTTLAVPALEAVALGAVPVLAGKAAQLIGARRDGELAATVDDALTKGVRAAADLARREGKTVRVVDDSGLMRTAVDVAADLAPKAFKAFGLDPTTDAGRTKIEKRVRGLFGPDVQANGGQTSQGQS
jgi:hypothetical protein